MPNDQPNTADQTFQESEWHTTKQAAEILGVTQIYVLKLIADKKLPVRAVFWGRRRVWRLHRDHILALKNDLEARRPKVFRGEIGAHLCGCGCGQETPIARRTSARRGVIKGQPCRFVQGHNALAGSPVQYLIDAETGCWVWQRHVNRLGYGRANGKAAHRVFYERKYGPVPHGKVLDHLCRNRACVNADHMEPVTQAENVRRGRSAKLTKQRADELRTLYAAGGHTYETLANRYGISDTMVANIVKGRWWRDY